MMIRRLAVLATSALLLGGGGALAVTDSAHATKKNAARTYGVVAGTQGECMSRFENLSRNLAGRQMISMLPCGRWNGDGLWSGSITVQA